MKLDSEYQKAMEEADENRPDFEDGEFEPLPDGFYRARVEKVSLSPRPGPSGYKQWVFVWRIEAPRKWAKRTQWDRISLSPKAAFKMREAFDACGLTYDSDSSELVGEVAILELVQEPIASGDRAGEIGNSVEKIYSVEDESAAAMVGK